MVASAEVLPFAVDTVTTAGIAAGAAVLGGLITLLGTVVNVRGKLAKEQLLYQHRLADRHFEAARSHIDTVYIPLSDALSALEDAFLLLRERASDAETPADVVDAFRLASASFLTSVSEILRGGNDAFLTAELDTRLRGFRAFLRASETATDITARQYSRRHRSLGGPDRQR